MKVNRIVDHTGINLRPNKEKLKDTDEMAYILEQRLSSYEKWFDLRIWAGKNITLEDLKLKTRHEINRYMKYINKEYTSTRFENDESKCWGMMEVLLKGMVPNEYGGGLFVRQCPFPHFDKDAIDRLASLANYQQRAKIILEKLIPFNQIRPQRLSLMISEAYRGFQTPLEVVVPVRNLTGNIYLEELFHGPTGSFKDLALQLLPRMIESGMSTDQRILYVVATSGDTGSAVLEGFGRLNNSQNKLAFLVMYPEDGISPIQKQQMVSFDGGNNVSVVGMKGNFDDCQKIVKGLFASKHFLSKMKK